MPVDRLNGLVDVKREGQRLTPWTPWPSSPGNWPRGTAPGVPWPNARVGEWTTGFGPGENRSHGFEYARKQEYWHTEGNFDFIGILSEQRRAAWRLQFFTRAFAAGIRKVAVMDAKPLEQTAVRTYIDVLPDPFPMLPAADHLSLVEGQVHAYRHTDGSEPADGQVWVVWAAAGGKGAVVEIPSVQDCVVVLTVDGSQRRSPAVHGGIRLQLVGDAKMPPPVLVVDRPGR